MVEVSGEDDNGKGIVRAPPSFQALQCTALRLVAQIRAIILVAPGGATATPGTSSSGILLMCCKSRHVHLYPLRRLI